MPATRVILVAAALASLWAGPLGPPVLFALGQTYTASPVKICPICSRPFDLEVYILKDEVAEDKKEVCPLCVASFPLCFLCSLPVNTNQPAYLALADGRHLCSRDARGIVRDDVDGLRLCEQVKDDLDRLLSRFIQLPENVEIAIVDRIHMQALYKVSGRDYQCPNTWGYFTASTNGSGKLVRQIRLLGDVPVSLFKITCAHEYAHAWLHQAISADRHKRIADEAEEGFCEMLAFMLADAQGDQTGKRHIQRNNYTRGQAALFIQAQGMFGFNDVAEWVLHGSDPRLIAQDLYRLHRVESPPRDTAPAKPLSFPPPASAVVYSQPVLQGVTWNQQRPLALVNGQTLATGDEATILLQTNRVKIRCLAITQSSARIRLLTTGEEKVLTLRAR